MSVRPMNPTLFWEDFEEELRPTEPVPKSALVELPEGSECKLCGPGVRCAQPVDWYRNTSLPETAFARGPIPTEAAARKDVPLFTGLIKYFPDALAAVAQLSKVGNDQHNPGQPLFWDRSKSTDELDALTRHLFEAGTKDIDGVLHSTKVAWRALANLQKELEKAK